MYSSQYASLRSVRGSLEDGQRKIVQREKNESFKLNGRGSEKFIQIEKKSLQKKIR